VTRDRILALPTPLRQIAQTVWPTGQHRPGIVPMRFVDCPACGVGTAATVHGQLVLCAEGHEIGGGQ
jgi:hypothetical protein